MYYRVVNVLQGGECKQRNDKYNRIREKNANNIISSSHVFQKLQKNPHIAMANNMLETPWLNDCKAELSGMKSVSNGGYTMCHPVAVEAAAWMRGLTYPWCNSCKRRRQAIPECGIDA